MHTAGLKTRVIDMPDWGLNEELTSTVWAKLSPQKEFKLLIIKSKIETILWLEDSMKKLASSLWMEYRPWFVTTNLSEILIWWQEVMMLRLYNGNTVCVNSDDLTLVKIRWVSWYVVQIFPEIVYNKQKDQMIFVQMNNWEMLWIKSDFSVGHRKYAKK